MKAAVNAEVKLTRARVQLLLSQPFFATLCLRLNLVSAGIPTMATNGRAIYYNPEFVESLTPEELQGVLAHEVLHCALAHHCRRGSRDARLWNEAADFAVNPIVLKNGLTLPADALIKPEYEGLSAEEIYARLLEDTAIGSKSNGQPGTAGASNPPLAAQPGPGAANAGSEASPNSTSQELSQNATTKGTSQSGVCDDATTNLRPGGFGEVVDAINDQGEPASEADKSRQAHEWSIAAEQAMRTAKACGHEVANMERPLREARESRQDWRAILRYFIAATVPSDYRWCPPNRRYIASGLYLPSVHREGVGTIVIGVDTSGSVGEEQLNQFAAEISAICDQAQPERIHVVYCDEEVNSFQEFGPSEPIRLEPVGGGGTNFRPVFQWVEEQNILPACLIYLTDLECHKYPDSSPNYPVLWVPESRRIVPFGETLRMVPD
jgi:predicted metal-dependent peptidase